jgi:site-specific recombinase XerD
MDIDESIDLYLEYLEVEKAYSPHTIGAYRYRLKRFSGWLTENSTKRIPEDIDKKIIRKYRLYLARLTDPKGRHLKKVTQRHYVVVLRAFLRYLAVHRDIATLSPDKIELPRSDARIVTFLNAEQLERLLNCPDTSETPGLRDRAILETLFSTGLRVSELWQLNRDQVNLERKEFGVMGKGNKPRVAFLSDTAAEWIERYLDSREDYFKPLFIRYDRAMDPARDGEKIRLSRRSIQKMVAKYAKMCFLPVKASPHTLRHSFATDLLIGGADIRSVQEMLGHDSIRTTQVYTHVTDRQLGKVHKEFHSRNRSSKQT